MIPPDQFPNFQPRQQLKVDDNLSGSFIPQDPNGPFHVFSPPIQTVEGGSDHASKKALVDNYGIAKEEGLLMEKNLNAMHVGLKARVSDVFAQIMRALSAQEETINNVLDERFADIGERLSCQDNVGMTSDITAEVKKVAEEIDAKLAEAKLMIDVINSLEKKKTLSAFFDYISSTNGSGSNTPKGDGALAPFIDPAPVIDTTLSKPMIRSWSDSASQAAVLITWTTPRDFELLHRSEGFWYELEQRLASDPEATWHNVYKGVERTFVCKNMQRGSKYLFRCCVCVARYRYSHWSPEVLITPGTGLPGGKQNMVTPEISKALEQEVARNFTSGAVNAAGSSGPAVVTTVIVPISNNQLSSSSSDSRSVSPATDSVSPSPSSGSPQTTAITTIAVDPAQAASTLASMSSSAASCAAVVAAASSQGSGFGNSVGKSFSITAFAPGPYYELSQSNKVATAIQPGAIVLGHALPKDGNILMSFRILRGSGIYVGVAPSNINQAGVRQYLYNGWFLDSATLSIGSRPPYKWKAKPAYPRGDLSNQQCIYFPREGDLVTLSFNSKTNCLRFSTVPGTYLPGKYGSVLAPGCHVNLVPAVVLVNVGDSVLLHSAVQGPN